MFQRFASLWEESSREHLSLSRFTSCNQHYFHALSLPFPPPRLGAHSPSRKIVIWSTRSWFQKLLAAAGPPLSSAVCTKTICVCTIPCQINWWFQIIFMATKLMPRHLSWKCHWMHQIIQPNSATSNERARSFFALCKVPICSFAAFFGQELGLESLRVERKRESVDSDY